MIKRQDSFAIFAVVVFMSAFIVPVAKAGEHESTKVDIAIGEKDFRVTKLSDRVFEVTIILRNRGSVPIPRFRVNFCAGDPDKGGRLLSPQQAGPLMPGDIWSEYNPGLELRPGEDVISVVVDPDNRVEETDETNNKVLRSISTIDSESEDVEKVEAIQELDLTGDDILLVEAQVSEGFNYPYYLFVPGGAAKGRPVYILVETNNSGMVSDDPEVHRAKALTLVERSHANEMAMRLGVPLLVPTFPRPRPETHSWAYTHALDIDTLEVLTGKLKRVDLQLTAMIKHAQELLRTNGFKINDKVFIHGFSASAKFCNRYSYLHPEMVKAAAAGGVNGLPTLPVREWNGYELPFPIGIAGIEKFTGKPFHETPFRQVAHYIYMGSSDRNDTLFSPEAWREEEADIIRKALAAPKMIPDRWELSRKIYRQQKLPAQLVTYNGVGHSIKSQMLDDVINFFKANSGEKYVAIKPYEYPLVEVEEARPKDRAGSAKIDIAIKDENLTVTKQPDGSFRAKIDIWNKGSHPFPKFRVNFYAGDPDKGGRLLAPHGAGPIKPGAGWGEYNPRLRLRPGEDTISVVVDPDNKVAETDETNNKASRVIPGRQTEQEPGSAKVDIAIADRDLSVTKLSDGVFRAVIAIYNKGSAPSPKFGVYFYAGEPDKGGRLLATHGAGPIMPGDIWREGTHPHRLEPDENTISVVVDPDNRVEESDETNNKASQVIPGRQAKRKTGSAKVDITVADRDLWVTELSDGVSCAGIAIYNKGSAPSPKFKVYFYAGDPEKGGRLLAAQKAGPIMPGDGWGEFNSHLMLRPVETVISVVVDPENKVTESDETNNKASAVITGRQPNKPLEADKSSKQTTQKEREKAARKVSEIDIKPTAFNIYFDKSQETCRLVVSIHNKSSLTIPKFKLKFYRGDPSNNVNEEGTKHSGTCGAGPLEPGKRWNSSTRNFHLPDGQYEFNVILDCDSNISEIDEDNNRAVLYVKIENGQIADKSVKCPAPAMPADSDESKVPAEMVGTWFFDNPHGDDEQMAVFPDGRVVTLYSNGHKDQTNIVDGSIELAEYNNARCRMTIKEDGSLVQYFGSDSRGSGKRWKRIAPPSPIRIYLGH